MMFGFKIRRVGPAYYVYRKEPLKRLDLREPREVPIIGDCPSFRVQSRAILAKGLAS